MTQLDADLTKQQSLLVDGYIRKIGTTNWSSLNDNKQINNKTQNQNQNPNQNQNQHQNTNQIQNQNQRNAVTQTYAQNVKEPSNNNNTNISQPKRQYRMTPVNYNTEHNNMTSAAYPYNYNIILNNQQPNRNNYNNTNQSSSSYNTQYRSNTSRYQLYNDNNPNINNSINSYYEYHQYYKSGYQYNANYINNIRRYIYNNNNVSNCTITTMYPQYRKLIKPSYSSPPSRSTLSSNHKETTYKSPRNPNLNKQKNILCVMFKTRGTCRHNAKCQWLHLDPVTGAYVPTLYVRNTLNGVDNNNKTTKEKHIQKYKNDNQNKNLQLKFQKLMEKRIVKNKNIDINNDLNKKNEEKQDNKTDKNDGNYGTLLDRQNESYYVCWEFNTFSGCRKGSNCKWNHKYLAKEVVHPYTGEKLNGVAVRKSRQKSNI